MTTPYEDGWAKTALPNEGPPADLPPTEYGAVTAPEATASGADMMVKGAYTHSRLRQMIFGGATSQILAAAEMPIFMAH